MLCAQHALNNLLQGNYFDAAQLAEIASQLDGLERENLNMTDSEWGDREAGGRNADETGERLEECHLASRQSLLSSRPWPPSGPLLLRILLRGSHRDCSTSMGIVSSSMEFSRHATVSQCAGAAARLYPQLAIALVHFSELWMG